MRLELDKLLLTIGFILFVSGCASTNGPKDLGALEYTGFVEKSDGTTYQSVMGLTCPEQIDGIPRNSTRSYNDKGTDVSCNYVGDERIFTVYLSRFPDDTKIDNFRSAQYHLENRLVPQGYIYDDDMSETCTSESLDTESFMAGITGLLTGENTGNEVTISPSPSAVYVTDTKMSVVIVEEMLEKDFFKVRYTGPYSGENSVKTTCKLARDTFLSMKKGVEKARGIEVSKEDLIQSIIDAAEES